jgi:hypothetical protein
VIKYFSINCLGIVATVWLALLIVGSLQPSRPGIVKGFHREIHWAAFAGAAVLLFTLAATRGQKIVAASGIFLLGVSLEIAQNLLYRCGMEWRDIGDDALAILAAFILYRLAAALMFRPDSRPQ